jgi:hypothetical protein
MIQISQKINLLIFGGIKKTYTFATRFKMGSFSLNFILERVRSGDRR